MLTFVGSCYTIYLSALLINLILNVGRCYWCGRKESHLLIVILFIFIPLRLLFNNINKHFSAQGNVQ